MSNRDRKMNNPIIIVGGAIIASLVGLLIIWRPVALRCVPEL